MNIVSLIYFSYDCDKKKSSHKSNLRKIKKPKGWFWLIVWGPAHVGREVLSVGAIGGWSHWNYSQEVGSNDCHVLFFIQSKIQVLGMYHSLLVCVFNPNNLIKIIIHRYKIIIHRDLILGPPPKLTINISCHGPEVWTSGYHGGSVCCVITLTKLSRADLCSLCWRLWRL